MSKVFVDSNLWIYAFLESQKDSRKRERVLQLLQELRKKSGIIVSVQVINEFHWLLARKYQVPEAEIRAKVKDGILKIAEVTPVQLSTYENATTLRDRYNLSFWDSLIVAAARENGCTAIYSEDMHHGLVIDKVSHVINPFG